jgi:sugar phosphate isomerase/epimerase
MQPRLSFGSWAFSFGPFESAPWSFDRLCRYAAEAGYDGVEINGFRPHAYFRDFTGADDFRELIALRDDLGLEYSGYAPDFHDVPPAVVDQATYLEAFEAALRFCDRLGISILRVDTVSPPAQLPAAEYEERFARLARTWNAAAELAAKLSVLLVWEFEPGFWLNRASEVVRLLEAVAHPNFKVLFDTSHAYTSGVAGARQGAQPELLAGGVTEYARLIEPYLGHLHLIDSDGSLHDEETSAHLPFGDGLVDFSAALQALQPSLDTLPWWTVDFCFCPTTERDARTAVPFVRDLMGRFASTSAEGRDDSVAV